MAKISKVFKEKLAAPLRKFIQDSRAVGITLIICTVISLLISNSAWQESYLSFWNQEWHFSTLPEGTLPHSMVHFINDGLMALFFLLVGMEIKREMLIGELASVKKSILPILAAVGGMVFPAVLYLFWNRESGFAHGWGIPMATDIAFSLGILSLLGSRAPVSLKILLTALAIIDDLGAIVAIAIFYTEQINGLYMAFSGGLFFVLLMLNRMKVTHLLFYFIPGLLLWYCLFNSGVHATLAGVLLAFTLPLKRISRLEIQLHEPVNFIVLPLFALANTAIAIPANLSESLIAPVSYGVLFGLILGKPLGITLLSVIGVKSGMASLPADLRWSHIWGMGMIAGIGFTMSIFISLLAFKDVEAQITAKISVLLGSVVSGLLGYIWLNIMAKKKHKSSVSSSISVW